MRGWRADDTGLASHFHKRPFSFQNQIQRRLPKFRSRSELAENAENVFLQKMQKMLGAQSRRHERPRSSRLQHSDPGGARCLSSASVAQMLAAASIKVMDALFGFPARNDAECCKRELLGRSWRRDWAMRRFHAFPVIASPQFPPT